MTDRALEAIDCIGCEGRPTAPNNPCALCGRLAASPSPSEMEVGATAWEGYWSGAGSISSTTKLTKDKDTAARWQDDGAEITPLYATPSNPVVSDEWPEPPEGWQRTKPTYARKDGALRVEFVHGREGTPWCVSMSLGNGACATLSYHATPQEALTSALSVKPQSGRDKP